MVLIPKRLRLCACRSVGKLRICVLSVQLAVPPDRPKGNVSKPRHGTSTDCTGSNLDVSDEQSLVLVPGLHDKTSEHGTRKRERPSGGTSQASGPGEGTEGAKRQSPSLDSEIAEAASLRAACRACAVTFLGTCRRCPGCGGVPDEFRIALVTRGRVSVSTEVFQNLVGQGNPPVPTGQGTRVLLRMHRYKPAPGIWDPDRVL